MELREHILRFDILVELVARETRLREIAAVEVVVVVDFDDPFHQCVETAVVEKIDEGLGIEIAVDQLVPPVDGNGVDQHRLENLLGGVARIRRVFEGDVEFVFPDEGGFVFHPSADVVVNAPAGIDLFVFRELLEEPDAELAVHVGDDEAAEVGLLPQDGLRVDHVRSNENLRVAVKHIERQPVMARVVEIVEGERVVVFVEVGPPVLAGEEDPHALVVLVAAAEFRIDQEVRVVAELDVVVPAEKVVEVVVGLVEVLPKVFEIDP